jgi:hypothetical protein
MSSRDQRNELRAKAKAALGGTEESEYQSVREAFRAAASPYVVLGLVEEVEQLRSALLVVRNDLGMFEPIKNCNAIERFINEQLRTSEP